MKKSRSLSKLNTAVFSILTSGFLFGAQALASTVKNPEETDSADLRADKIAIVSTNFSDPLFYNTVGLNLGYFVEPSLQIESSFEFGEVEFGQTIFNIPPGHRVLGTSRSYQGAIGVIKWLGNSAFFSFSLHYLEAHTKAKLYQKEQVANVSRIEYESDSTASVWSSVIGFGNEWLADDVVIGCKWFEYKIPITPINSSHRFESNAPDEAQFEIARNRAEDYAFNPYHWFRLYVGFAL